jgi:two-component system phosphate regulon sensor histidine kinase PhoR
MISAWWLLLLFALLIAAGWLWRREQLKNYALERQFRSQLREAQSSLDELSNTKSLQASALQASQECLLVFDSELQVQLANNMAQECFGELKGKPTLISYTRSLPLEQLIHDALVLDKAQELVRVININEKPHRATINSSAEFTTVSLIDVSEVQRLSRARQDMVANLSHELRTPLTSLKLLAETLQSPAGEEPSVAAGLLDKIKDEVDSLEQIAREMLDLAAIESGRQAVRLVETDLRSIVREAVDHIADQAVRKGVEFNIEFVSEFKVLADSEQSSRAILNVLHNALKFTPERSQIVIQAAESGKQGSMKLTIADEGPGIPPYELERIFERFYRGDQSRGTPGTGLGLAIARHIMRSHGGEIMADNRPAPQNGAIFSLVFQTP